MYISLTCLAVTTQTYCIKEKQEQLRTVLDISGICQMNVLFSGFLFSFIYEHEVLESLFLCKMFSLECFGCLDFFRYFGFSNHSND